MNALVKTLLQEFADKDYAHAYMEEFSNMAIAAQIKALREQRGWTQEELATAADMKQERISALEDVNYDAWTLKTLRKLAKAFDLPLQVCFGKFSEAILEVVNISKSKLERPSREKDIAEFSSRELFYADGELYAGAKVMTKMPLGYDLKSIGISANDDGWNNFDGNVVTLQRAA